MTEDIGFKVTDRRGQADEQDGRPCGCAAADQNASHKYMMPKVTFGTFILSLSSTALVSLGEVPEPESGEMRENLPLAKHTIDILVMLKEKTARCLTSDEAQLLDGILYELRMKYVMQAQ